MVKGKYLMNFKKIIVFSTLLFSGCSDFKVTHKFYEWNFDYEISHYNQLLSKNRDIKNNLLSKLDYGKEKKLYKKFIKILKLQNKIESGIIYYSMNHTLSRFDIFSVWESNNSCFSAFSKDNEIYIEQSKCWFKNRKFYSPKIPLNLVIDDGLMHGLIIWNSKEKITRQLNIISSLLPNSHSPELFQKRINKTFGEQSQYMTFENYRSFETE